MIKQSIRTRWSKEDCTDLAILFHIGSTKTEIAKILGRTQSSISKMLTRLKLVNPKDSFYAFKPDRPQYLKKSALLDDVKECLLRFKEKHRDYLESLQFESSYIFIKELLPLQKIPRSRQRIKFISPRTEPPLEQWYTIKEVKHFLRQQGHQIHPLSHPKFRELGYQFLIDGTPSTPEMLLVKANQLTEGFGKTPFYVSGITEENA